MAARIIATVEFEPSHLGVEDFRDLQDSGEWPAHWAALLEGWDLRPIQPGSWFVAAATFDSPRAFELLLRVRARDVGEPDGLPPVREVLPLPGGLAFADGEDVTVEPGCCCSLSDIADWRDAFHGNGRVALTVGHGKWSIESTDGVTTVQLDPERLVDTPRVLSYSHAEFDRALVEAETERDRFVARLERHLCGLTSTSRARETARKLALGR